LNSYNNYLSIFETILLDKENITIPVQWVWDILDEFLYQYQSFCNFRAKMKDGDDANFQNLISTQSEIWNMETIKEIFTNLIDRSKIVKANKTQLEEVTAGTKTL